MEPDGSNKKNLSCKFNQFYVNCLGANSLNIQFMLMCSALTFSLLRVMILF